MGRDEIEAGQARTNAGGRQWKIRPYQKRYASNVDHFLSGQSRTLDVAPATNERILHQAQTSKRRLCKIAHRDEKKPPKPGAGREADVSADIAEVCTPRWPLEAGRAHAVDRGGRAAGRPLFCRLFRFPPRPAAFSLRLVDALAIFSVALASGMNVFPTFLSPPLVIGAAFFTVRLI